VNRSVRRDFKYFRVKNETNYKNHNFIFNRPVMDSRKPVLHGKYGRIGMKPTTVLGLATGAVLSLSASIASAAMSNAEQSRITPPPGYTSQWWIHPNGCEYSRAGRPGEIVWYRILNSVGNKKCVLYVVQTPYPGDAQSNIVRQSTKLPSY
jgi:hypothetical protein